MSASCTSSFLGEPVPRPKAVHLSSASQRPNSNNPAQFLSSQLPFPLNIDNNFIISRADDRFLSPNPTRYKDKEVFVMELPDTYVKGFHNEESVKRITYTTLGDTSLKLSKLGIGGGSLGNHYGMINESEGVALVKRGIQSGINYIDTSPYYGHTYSETLIGKALTDIPREAYYISTKVGRYGTSWSDFFDHSAQRIVKEFLASLQRLGLKYVDIVFVHDIEFSNLETILNEALPATRGLVDKGLARYLGISGYPLSTLREVVEKSPVKIDVVLSYARDTLIDSTMNSYASFFQARGVGLINASLTGMGLLTNAGPPDWHPALPSIKHVCRQASLYCQEVGLELGDLAIYDSMQRPYFSSHLVGMKTLLELEANLRLATCTIGEPEIRALQEIKRRFFSSAPDQHWEGVEIEQCKQHQCTTQSQKNT